LGLLGLLSTFLDNLDTARVCGTGLELGFAVGNNAFFQITALMISNNDLSA
jgi:hypothetical protein